MASLILNLMTFLSFFAEKFCYVQFHQNLCLRTSPGHRLFPTDVLLYIFSHLSTILFIIEYPNSLMATMFIVNIEIPSSIPLIPKPTRYTLRLSAICWSIMVFSFATGSSNHTMCLIIFQITCEALNKNKGIVWLPLLLIILSNDIHRNPGPLTQTNFLKFMSWNLNSIVKNNFQRVQLLEAHNALFNYDLISINETCLNDSIDIPEVLLDDYTFVNANNSNNTRHGGVGLFYKNSLPLRVRHDLSFSESIVVEIKYHRKSIFFTVLYRSPAHGHSTPVFNQFLSDLNQLYEKIRAEKPLAMFFAGDFNAHSQSWWPDCANSPEGRSLDDLFSSLNLYQLINEPTNFEPNKNPTCIDLIATDQPNLVLDSGTRSSLDSFCHHQIIHCKINVRIPPPPPYERKVWHFNQANAGLIRRSIVNFPWNEQLNLNNDPTWQVKTFTDTILNIMSNFVPNEVKRVTPRDPPWLTKPLKTLLKKKNRLFTSYKNHGYKKEDKVRLDAFRSECKEAVELAKCNYTTNLGNKLNNSASSSKTYWKLVKRVMNKSKSPTIPPLLVDNSFVISCREKCKHFADFFSKQCKLVINDSILPQFQFLTNERIDTITIQENEITSLIRNLNPNKAMGSDGLSAHMLLLCDSSISLPLKLIFQNILESSLYPNQWKLANVTPIHKKRTNKQLVIIDPFPYSQFAVKCLKNWCLIVFIHTLTKTILSLKTNLVFVLVTSQPTNYYTLSMKFMKLLKIPSRLKCVLFS